MTTTIIEPDTENLTEADLSFAPRCDGVLEDNSDCELPAEYRTHVACCGAVLLFCEDCLLNIMSAMKYLAPNSHTCKMCNHRIEHPEKHIVYDGPLA